MVTFCVHAFERSVSTCCYISFVDLPPVNCHLVLFHLAFSIFRPKYCQTGNLGVVYIPSMTNKQSGTFLSRAAVFHAFSFTTTGIVFAFLAVRATFLVGFPFFPEKLTISFIQNISMFEGDSLLFFRLCTRGSCHPDPTHCALAYGNDALCRQILPDL